MLNEQELKSIIAREVQKRVSKQAIRQGAFRVTTPVEKAKQVILEYLEATRPGVKVELTEVTRLLRGVHLKYIITAAKTLEKENLIGYDGVRVWSTSETNGYTEMMSREQAEMAGILRLNGYDPDASESLQQEGMSPDELRGRLRGEPEALTVTHGLQRKLATVGVQTPNLQAIVLAVRDRYLCRPES